MSSKALLAIVRTFALFVSLSVFFCKSTVSQTNIRGNIEGVLTKAGSPYVIASDLTVLAGKTLTIEPGVEVVVSFYAIAVYGTIIANGTVGDSIKFTSSTQPPFGSGRFQIREFATSNSFRFCRFDNLGYYTSSSINSAMLLLTPDCSIENSLFINTRSAINITFSDALNRPALPVIKNNRFFSDASSLDFVTTPEYASLLDSNGPLKAGFYAGSFAGDMVFRRNNIYGILGNLTVPVNSTLTIEPGSQVNFATANTQLNVNGTLQAEGTIQDSIRFSTLILGGTAGMGGPINFAQTSTNSSLSFCRFDKIGYANPTEGQAAIVIKTPDFKMQNCLLTNITGSAVSIETQTALVVNNRISGTTQFDVIGRLDNVSAFDSNGGSLKIGIRNGLNLDVTLRKENSYKFLTNINVPTGRKLTLNPGVEIKFAPGISLLEIGGTLIAEGTAQDSIRFTGQPGGTSTIQYLGPVTFLNGSINNSLAYVSANMIGYRPINGSAYSFTVRSASTAIRSSRIVATAGGSGIFLDSVAATIADNVFVTDGTDVGLVAEHLPTITGSTGLKIGIYGIGANAARLTRNHFYTLMKKVTVPQTTTLTIDPGIELNFAASTGLSVEGTLIAEGTSTDSIRFTGTRLSPFSGSLDFQNSSISNSLKYVTIKNLGTGSAVYLRTPSCLLSNCSIVQLNGSGVSFELLNPQLNVLRPQVVNSRFDCPTIDIIMTTESLSRITNNGRLRIGLQAPFVSSTRLTTEHVYTILTSGSIAADAVFNIDPGVKVVFFNTALTVLGTLNAIGTEAENIRFTYKRGPVASLDYGGGFNFQKGSMVVLKNVTIDSFGRKIDIPSAYFASILVATQDFMMENCTLRNFSNCDIQVDTYSSPNIKIINTSFSNLELDAVVSIPGVKYFSQNSRGMRIGITRAYVTTTETLPAVNPLYRFLGDINIESSAKLTIEPGVRIEFLKTSYPINFSISGTLIARGTKENPITLATIVVPPTGINRNGMLILDQFSKNSVLSFVNIEEFGGLLYGKQVASLTVQTSSCTISNISIKKSTNVAMSLEAPGIIVSNSCFYDNLNGAVNSITGSHQFVNCNFSRNASFAINNASTIPADIITATNCWWGNASGPSHYTTNPQGTGDAISDKVSFAPWVTTAFECNRVVDAPQSPLPVTLVYFKGRQNEETVTLEWQTATEINASRFIVQRSIDGVNFTNVGTLPARNTVTLNNYQYDDHIAISGSKYYRLKMIDKDDRFEYSQVIVINNGASIQGMVIYPNPVRSVLHLQINSDRFENRQLKIYDLQGRLRKTQNVRMTPGLMTIAVNVADLENGVYMLEFMGLNGGVKKFAKE